MPIGHIADRIALQTERISPRSWVIPIVGTLLAVDRLKFPVESHGQSARSSPPVFMRLFQTVNKMQRLISDSLVAVATHRVKSPREVFRLQLKQKVRSNLSVVLMDDERPIAICDRHLTTLISFLDQKIDPDRCVRFLWIKSIHFRPLFIPWT